MFPSLSWFCSFFFNDTATTEIYTLSLHDALPICDTLVVEGTVEATMDSRVIQIAEQGAFHGTAEIDIAEIHGVFDGTLTVREKLVIYGTGKVSGKIRYGKVVIEEGGELTGQIEAGSSPCSSSWSA